MALKIEIKAILWDGSIKAGTVSFLSAGTIHYARHSLMDSIPPDEEITTTQEADVRIAVDPNNYALVGSDSESTERKQLPSHPGTGGPSEPPGH